MKKSNLLWLTPALLFACNQKQANVSDNVVADSTNSSKPNVIYIFADDLGYGDLGCYGQQKIKTPNIDNMAMEGMRFTQHYSGSTVSAPSRCVLMTGKHTGHSYIRGNEFVGDYDKEIADSVITLGEIFKQSGYTTGVCGKWTGGPDSEGNPLKQGFDFAYGYLSQIHAHYFYPDSLWDNGKTIKLDKKTYSQDLISQKAHEFIVNNKQKPFFLYFTLTLPHAELIVPDNSLAEYDGKFVEEKPYDGKDYHYCAQPKPRATFAGMVTRLDTYVGEIFKLLKEQGLDKNTIVMFSSDNGCHNEGGADPDFFDSNGAYKGYKRDMYDGGVRVPFIAWYPEKISANTTSNHISAFWDVIPTFCDILGVETPKGLDGISFYPTLFAKEEQKQHEYLYWEFFERGGKTAIRKGDYKAIRLNVHKNAKAPIELYNIISDPGEEKNIAKENPAIIKEMDSLFTIARFESPIFKFDWEKKISSK